MNTDEGLPTALPQPEVSFEVPEEKTVGDLETLSSNIARLETDLANEREDRREKEFIYIAAIAFLGSVLAFKVLENTVLSLVLFLFEAVILTGLANRMGVDWAVQGIGWLTHLISERFSKDGGEKD